MLRLLALPLPSGHGFMSAVPSVVPLAHCSTAKQAMRPQPVAYTSQSPLDGSRTACGVDALKFVTRFTGRYGPAADSEVACAMRMFLAYVFKPLP